MGAAALSTHLDTKCQRRGPLPEDRLAGLLTAIDAGERVDDGLIAERWQNMPSGLVTADTPLGGRFVAMLRRRAQVSPLGWVTGSKKPRPTHPLILFRGGHRRGLAWSYSLCVARQYDSRARYFRRGLIWEGVWHATVHPASALMYIEAPDREIVVDPDLVTPLAMPPAAGWP